MTRCNGNTCELILRLTEVVDLEQRCVASGGILVSGASLEILSSEAIILRADAPRRYLI